MEQEQNEHIEAEEMFDENVSFADVGVCEELVEKCEKLGYKYPTIIQR
jgi:superfamily II DNA/RNA helicase